MSHLNNLRGHNLQLYKEHFRKVIPCGYVSEKVRRLCSGKSADEKEVKGIKERKCVLSQNVKTLPSGNVAYPITQNPPDSVSPKSTYNTMDNK